MPTHYRQAFACSTLKTLFRAYSDYGFDVSCICIDSTSLYSDDISQLPFVQYIHKPDCKLQNKYNLAKKYLTNLKIPPTSAVLWTPDDDLFLPNEDLVAFFERSFSPLSKFVIPFRYYFFSDNPVVPGYLVIQEKWMHHQHISSLSVSAVDRLNAFVGYGVNSCWGLFSVPLFLDICDFSAEMTKFLHESYYILLEDFWNIIILSADWINIVSPPICFRGNDRRFSQSPTWKSSFTAWSEIDSLADRRAIAQILLKYLLKYIPQLIDVKKDVALDYVINLVTAHVKGYIEANSRMFSSGINLCLAPDHVANKLSSPRVIVIKNKKDDVFIALPKKLKNINNSLFPPSHPLSNKSLCQGIDKYKDFLWADRS